MAAHPFVHMELSAQDPAAASKFYADLCGWKIERDPNFDYYQFDAEGGPGGGFVKPDGQIYKPGTIVPYIGTDDVDAMLKKAESLGARVLHPKTEIPGVGWYAIFGDPSGNQIGLFASNR